MPERPRRVPLARLLVERGLFPDAARATAWILAGDVRVDGRPVRWAGQAVPEDAALAVRGLDAYASRGGLKLAFALDRFGVAAAGRVALDCGASAGGFTDCLVRRGAARVYAVDVGFGQLVGRLRQEPRVVNLERTNLAELRRPDPPPDLVTLDLSYLSLRRAVPLAAALLAPGGDILALVKPLFEARLDWPVASAEAYRPVLAGLLGDLAARAEVPALRALAPSPVLGAGGSQEFWLHLGPGGEWRRAPKWVDRAVAELTGAAVAQD